MEYADVICPECNTYVDLRHPISLDSRQRGLIDCDGCNNKIEWYSKEYSTEVYSTN